MIILDAKIYKTTKRVQTVMLNHSWQTRNKIFIALYRVYLYCSKRVRAEPYRKPA